MLAIVQAPYSPDFALVFLPLVQNSEITAPLKNAKGTDPVSNFLAEYLKKENVTKIIFPAFLSMYGNHFIQQ